MEEIDVLKGVRVLSRRGVKGKGDVKLMMGDLVYDEKNNENGILLAVKPPIEVGKYMENNVAEKSMLANIPIQTFPEANTCTIMTLSKDPKTGENMLRVRYTASKYLKRIEEVHEEVQTLTDLDNHCQNECFLECNPECSLWKYRKS
jgi:hypothetical protein